MIADYFLNNRWLWLCAGVLLALIGQAVYPQVDGGRVLLDVTDGKAYVSPNTAGLKDRNALVERVWITVSFSDPSRAHAMVVVVSKDGKDIGVNLALKDRYARGSTTEFKGMPVVGKWEVRIRGESPMGIGIFMTIDCIRGPSAPVHPGVYPSPTPTPQPRPSPSPGTGGELVITPEIQFQALTRILIRKGVITAPELADEIHRVARERR